MRKIKLTMNRLSEENKEMVYALRQKGMKEVTLKIPGKKLGFFMELIKQLGIEVSTEAMKRIDS